MNQRVESLPFTHDQSVVIAVSKVNPSVSLHFSQEVEIPGAAATGLQDQVIIDILGFGLGLVGANDRFGLFYGLISGCQLAEGSPPSRTILLDDLRILIL